jgi:GNAT superfamily N-acetyltransferase
MIPDIIVPKNPGPAIRNALLDFMIAYNESKTGPSGLAPLAIILEDPITGQMVGGLWGRSVYDWLFVELLIVPETARGMGIGTRLMQKAEAEAIARGCCGICLDSFDFQAPGFYKKLGFEVFTSLDSPRRGFKRHFLKKALAG